MRNRMYGGVRGRKAKVGRKLLRFPPTRLYDVLMVGSITYVHMLPNMALKPLAANVPPRRMKGYF